MKHFSLDAKATHISSNLKLILEQQSRKIIKSPGQVDLFSTLLTFDHVNSQPNQHDIELFYHIQLHLHSSPFYPLS